MTRILKFEREGCMPCKKLDMILNKLGIEVEHWNLDTYESDGDINLYQLSSTPTLVRINNDGSFDKLTGIQHTTSEFKEFCEV